jgi:hypothetical protein
LDSRSSCSAVIWTAAACLFFTCSSGCLL